MLGHRNYRFFPQVKNMLSMFCNRRECSLVGLRLYCKSIHNLSIRRQSAAPKQSQEQARGELRRYMPMNVWVSGSDHPAVTSAWAFSVNPTQRLDYSGLQSEGCHGNASDDVIVITACEQNPTASKTIGRRLTTPTTGRSTTSVSSGQLSRSGSARLGRSQKDGLPFRLLVLSICRLKAIDARGRGLLVAPLLWRVWRRCWWPIPLTTIRGAHRRFACHHREAKQHR
jgi:hypothetical protein